MARKQSAAPKRPGRPQPRPQPYTRSLPFHNGPIYPSRPIEPQLVWDEAVEVHNEGRQAFPRGPYTPSSDGPPTPSSTLSSDTISRKISPCLTNASLNVEYTRYRSPLSASTPEDSGFGYGQPYQAGPSYDYIQPAPFSSWHDNSLTPPESVSSSVVGIVPTPETEAFPQRRYEFVSREVGTAPTQLQQYPRNPGPWSGFPLRQDDPMLLDTTPSPSAALSPGSNPDKRSRRQGPLSPEGRRNANQVRDRGACLRCSCMRERCDTEAPSCSNCRDKKGRKWKLGCIRDTLDSRMDFLFPAPISNRYGAVGTSKYIEDSAFFYLDRPDFALNLTTRLHGGLPIPVRVKEIEPVAHERLVQYYKSNVEANSNSHDQFWDPPIVLYLENKPEFFEQTRRILSRSMQEVFTKTHPNGFYWPWDCFDFPQMDWLGEVVELIHQYSQSATNLPFFQLIHKADSLLFFNYLLDHTFLIDGDQRDQLFSHLSQPPPYRDIKWISSETISRSLKAVVFPFIEKFSKEVLAELHNLLLQMSKSKEASSARHDLAFCLSFLMLVVVGQNQARLLSLADLSQGEKCIDLSKEDALNHIREMEEQVGTFIIQFHEFAVKKRRQPAAPTAANMNKPEEQYAARFGLLAKVAEITQRHRVYTRSKKTFIKAESPADVLEPESFDLGDFSIDRFEAQNIHRLCWKFMDAIVEWRQPA